MKNETKPFYETVAEKLIEQLREGTAPWQKPWQAGEPNTFLPMNPVTDQRYKGINALQLMSQGYEDPRWMTYKQAASLDLQVRAGEKGTRIQYWKFSEEQVRAGEDGQPLLDARGKAVKDTVALERPKHFFATVFNAAQIDGMPPLARQAQEWDPIARAEGILQASGASITHGQQDSAFYRPDADTIHLPNRSRFPDAQRYYATALHELGHWTGHPSRLDRDLAHPFGSEAYAREELRAEIASMILGDTLGIGHDPGQHAAYVGSWIKALQDEPMEIFRAAADAEKIQGYLIGLEQVLLQEQDMRQQQAVAATVPLPDDDSELRQALFTPSSDSADTAEPQARRTEEWLLAQLLEGTLLRALDRATIGQLERIDAALSTFLPVAEQNLFWQRHPLPEDADAMETKIHSAQAQAAQLVADAPLVEARQHLLTGPQGDQQEAAQGEYARAAVASLGAELPEHWNGGIHIALVAENEQATWSVFVQQVDGFRSWVGDRDTEQEAEKLAERLALVDARSTPDEYEKAAKLARINEERVRRDPDSTDEDISAARERRKNAEFAQTINDEDLQRRIEAERDKQASQRMDEARVYINVPYNQKDEAKALGARWDRQEQSWYVPAEVDAGAFVKWQRAASTAAERTSERSAAGDGQPAEAQRLYLAVPYRDRAEAKEAGARWDVQVRSWYAGEQADMARLQKWLPSVTTAQQPPPISPREEFAEALRTAGCVVDGAHPIMDGRKHRIQVEGDKPSERSGAGFYVGHMDGHPAGYVKNNKTGAEMTWKAKGYALTPQQKAALAAGSASRQREREAALAKRHEQAAARVARQAQKLKPVLQPTAYMRDKGIAPQPGALTDKDGEKTYLPATDAQGKQWTMQYIQEDGSKRFARDSRKEGCFHAVGGMEALAAAPVLVIAEGYATAVTLGKALGQATVAAFDAGNLAPVAQSLHQRFPGKPVIIAGDDDRHLELTQGVNPGRSKAEAAAELVGGKVMLPVFGPGENNYPDHLPPITPALYKRHQRGDGTISDAQLEALSSMKRHTDFNDLATHSVLGMEAVERQLQRVVAAVITAQELMLTQKTERHLHVELPQGAKMPSHLRRGHATV
ncbi:zincin-like metallopeptidase domain-containing protein [Oxalobacteraceae bacterium A2-2]